MKHIAIVLSVKITVRVKGKRSRNRAKLKTVGKTES